MTFNAQAWLDSHDADPLKALESLAAKRDEEGKDAARARRQRDKVEGERDALTERLADAEKRAAPEGATVLTGDDATAWQTFNERGGLSAFEEAAQAKTERDILLQERVLDNAAKFAGVDRTDLAEFLGDRKPVSRQVKDGENEVEVYGLGEGDAWKPLTEFKAVQALASAPAQPAQPPAKPLPTGGAGQKAEPKTVEQRTAEVRKEISI